MMLHVLLCKLVTKEPCSTHTIEHKLRSAGFYGDVDLVASKWARCLIYKSQDDMTLSFYVPLSAKRLIIPWAPKVENVNAYLAGVWNTLQPSLLHYLKDSGVKSLTVTGHARGGALALVAKDCIRSESPVDAIVFGAPKVGKHIDAINIVTEGDPLPKFPLLYKHEPRIVLPGFGSSIDDYAIALDVERNKNENNLDHAVCDHSTSRLVV